MCGVWVCCAISRCFWWFDVPKTWTSRHIHPHQYTPPDSTHGLRQDFSREGEKWRYLIHSELRKQLFLGENSTGECQILKSRGDQVPPANPFRSPRFKAIVHRSREPTFIWKHVKALLDATSEVSYCQSALWHLSFRASSLFVALFWEIDTRRKQAGRC